MIPVRADRGRSINDVTERELFEIASLGQNENRFSFCSSLAMIRSVVGNEKDARVLDKC
jgi:hypothetical protein